MSEANEVCFDKIGIVGSTITQPPKRAGWNVSKEVVWRDDGIVVDYGIRLREAARLEIPPSGAIRVGGQDTA